MQVAEVAPGIFQVPIPIPVPLRTVNTYILRGSHGWTIVDTGFHYPAAETAWQLAFAHLGLGPGDVEQIVVTHAHPDHFGMAGRLQEWTGAPVLLHERELDLAHYWWDPLRAVWKDLEPFFAGHGVPRAAAMPIGADHRVVSGSMVTPLPRRLTPVREGQVLRLGAREFRALCTPGHSEGLMVLWSEAEGILLANDMLLVDISPNISVWPGRDPNPLAAYLDSLQAVARLPARQVLTGHRRPVADPGARTLALADHHRRRLEATLDLVAAGPPRKGTTAYDICGGLFGAVRNANLYATLFAMGETLAHLEYLVAAGRLLRADGPVIRYRPAPRGARRPRPATVTA